MLELLKCAHLKHSIFEHGISTTKVSDGKAGIVMLFNTQAAQLTSAKTKSLIDGTGVR